jgi:hypothetical protein
MELIDYEQEQRLYEVMSENCIRLDWVKKVFNVNTLKEVNVWQYNYLLLIIEKVKEINGK